MSDAPTPYSVSYSGRVQDAVRALVSQATAPGLRSEALAELREVDRRLKIYPQFGEPLFDLLAVPGTEWAGFVGPLVVRYVLVEELRQVWVVSPITLARRFTPPGG